MTMSLQEFAILAGAMVSTTTILVGIIKLVNSYVSKTDLPSLIQQHGIVKTDLQKEVSPYIYEVCTRLIKENNVSIQKDIQIAVAPILSSLDQLKTHIDEKFDYQQSIISQVRKNSTKSCKKDSGHG